MGTVIDGRPSRKRAVSSAGDAVLLYLQHAVDEPDSSLFIRKLSALDRAMAADIIRRLIVNLNQMKAVALEG